MYTLTNGDVTEARRQMSGDVLVSLLKSLVLPEDMKPKQNALSHLKIHRHPPPINQSIITIAIAAFFLTAHCGANSGHFETSIIHFPTSEGVSKVRERANK